MIEHLPANITAESLRSKEPDQVALNWEQRRWTRGKLTTAKGREIALALPTGTNLEPEVILFVGADWYLQVVAATDSVLQIAPADHQQAIKIAFEVGNRHFPLALHEETLLVPDDTAMTQLLNRLHVHWERRDLVFNPIGKAHSH